MNKPLTCHDAYGLYGQNDECPRWGWSSSYNWGMLSTRDIGTYVTDIGFHCPIPGTRDVMQLWGRTLSGKGYDDFYFTGCGPCISGNLGLSELNPTSPNVTIGGNYTFEADMVRRANEMSEHTGGNNVHYFSQASDGVLLDAVKAGIAKNIIALPADRECARFMEPIIKNAGPDGIVNTECFSRGAVLVKNLPHLLPEGDSLRLDVRNYGEAAILDKKSYYDVENYFSEYDPVPILSAPIAYIQAKMFPRGDVFLLKSKTFPYMDHSWYSETYQKVIIPHHEKILNNNNRLSK